MCHKGNRFVIRAVDSSSEKIIYSPPEIKSLGFADFLHHIRVYKTLPQTINKLTIQEKKTLIVKKTYILMYKITQIIHFSNIEKYILVTRDNASLF